MATPCFYGVYLCMSMSENSTHFTRLFPVGWERIKLP